MRNIKLLTQWNQVPMANCINNLCKHALDVAEGRIKVVAVSYDHTVYVLGVYAQDLDNNPYAIYNPVLLSDFEFEEYEVYTEVCIFLAALAGEINIFLDTSLDGRKVLICNEFEDYMKRLLLLGFKTGVVRVD